MAKYEHVSATKYQQSRIKSSCLHLNWVKVSKGSVFYPERFAPLWYRSNFWPRKVFEGHQYHVVASQIQFWTRVLLRIRTKIVRSNFLKVDQNWILTCDHKFWKAIDHMITCKIAILVRFQIVKMHTFDSNSKLDFGPKVHLLSEHVILMSFKNFSGTKIVPRT